MHDWIGLIETADLLSMSTKDVVRAVEREELQGQFRQGRWEFRSGDVRDYLQQRLPNYTDARLGQLDRLLAKHSGDPDNLMLAPLLHEEAIALPLRGTSKASILRELVEMGDKLGLVWDRPALQAAVEDREALCSTGIGAGVALPHPRQMPPYAVAETFLAFGRSVRSIPYESVDGKMVDLFFLICSTEESIHLHLLARLCRILRDGDTLEELRQVESPAQALELLTAAEARCTAAG